MYKTSYGTKPSSAVANGLAIPLTIDVSNKYFSDNKQIELLDLGSGKGHFIKSLPQNFKTVGVDYNTLSDYTVNISYEKLPFQDKSFDMVTAWQVLEHLENPFFASREIERVLRPGGLFLMSVPNIKRLRSRFHYLQRASIPRWSKQNDHIFVPLESILKKAIFKNLKLVHKECSDGDNLSKLLPTLFAKNSYYVAQKPKI